MTHFLARWFLRCLRKCWLWLLPTNLLHFIILYFWPFYYGSFPLSPKNLNNSGFRSFRENPFGKISHWKTAANPFRNSKAATFFYPQLAAIDVFCFKSVDLELHCRSARAFAKKGVRETNKCRNRSLSAFFRFPCQTFFIQNFAPSHSYPSSGVVEAKLEFWSKFSSLKPRNEIKWLNRFLISKWSTEGSHVNPGGFLLSKQRLCTVHIIIISDSVKTSVGYLSSFGYAKKY